MCTRQNRKGGIHFGFLWQTNLAEPSLEAVSSNMLSTESIVASEEKCENNTGNSDPGGENFGVPELRINAVSGDSGRNPIRIASRRPSSRRVILQWWYSM